MSHLVRWWDGRSGGEKLALGIAGALAVVATGGALAYAIATEGLVVASGGTLVVVGNDVARAGLKAPNARGRSSRDGANP